MFWCTSTITGLSFIRYFSRNCPAKTWKLNVKPFWKLKADVNDCHLEIKPFDPNEYIDGSLLQVKVLCKDKLESKSPEDFKVVADEVLQKVFITNSNNSSIKGSTLVISTPPAFNIDVTAIGLSAISISNLESISIRACTDQGDVCLKNIKSERIESSTNLGSIISSGILQGNLFLKAKNGDVLAEKVQAPEANVQTDRGLLSLRDVYSDEFNASAKTGNITIQSLHGNSKIHCGHGNVSIGTIEGTTHAVTDAGNINVYVATSSPMKFLSKKGDIDISFAEGLAISFYIETKSILSEHLELHSNKDQKSPVDGLVNGGESLIEARAVDGSINVKSSTWIKRINDFRKLLKDIKAS